MKRHSERQDDSFGIMDEIGIGLLSLKHEKAAFDCGKPALNAFLRKRATFNIERGVSRDRGVVPIYVTDKLD